MNLSHVVDIHLKQSLETIPAYIRDTKDFINIIENTKVPPNALLVTLNITGLYLNIPQAEGIRRVSVVSVLCLGLAYLGHVGVVSIATILS